MNPILMAVILVVVIAIICSVMLVIASTVMAVPEDPKFPAIRECLPGANCGAYDVRTGTLFSAGNRRPPMSMLDTVRYLRKI